jgi:Fic family protein
VLDPATIKRLSDADRSLGELKGVGRMLPNPHLLIGPFLRREAVASSRIEGTITDLRQLLLFEADPSEGSGLGAEDEADRREVLNYVAALTYGLKRLESLPVSLRLMREVHERLMAGVRGEEKRPGEFRDRQNAIGWQGQTPDQARFVPPPVPQMKQALYDLEQFIGNRSELPVLVELALIHYQFETIHPFLDGNGRLGRLLISLLLCEREVLTRPLLYLSAYFEENRAEYMDHLLRVSQSGDWTGWTGFFLEGVAVQARKAIDRCNQLIDLWNGYRSRVQKVGQSSNLTLLVDLLFERPAISVARAREHLKVTNTAAQQNVDRLVEDGMLVEVTGRKRNRIYLAPRILEIIESP